MRVDIPGLRPTTRVEQRPEDPSKIHVWMDGKVVAWIVSLTEFAVWEGKVDARELGIVFAYLRANLVRELVKVSLELAEQPNIG